MHATFHGTRVADMKVAELGDYVPIIETSPEHRHSLEADGHNVIHHCDLARGGDADPGVVRIELAAAAAHVGIEFAAADIAVEPRHDGPGLRVSLFRELAPDTIVGDAVSAPDAVAWRDLATTYAAVL